MKRTLAQEIPQKKGEEVLFNGWVSAIRRLGGLTFLNLRDRSGLIQGVVSQREIEKNPRLCSSLATLSKESCVLVRGVVKEEKQAPQGVEIVIEELDIISKARELPFEIGRRHDLLNLPLNTILDYRALSLRNPFFGGIFRVQMEIIARFREFLSQQGFLEVHTSKIISQATEGGAGLFSVQYFEKKAYLAQSPQFYKQMLVGAGYERVYEVGFVYRAEDHETTRHLNEYLSLDWEMGFIKDENDLMDLETDLLRYIFLSLKKMDLSLYDIEIEEIKEIPRIEYSLACELVRSQGKEQGGDFTPEEERKLCQYARERYGSDFVFITKFPQNLRPFYTMPDERPGISRGFDLLYKGMEITTGSQRIHDYDLLIEKMKEAGLNPEDFKFYLEIFKYGMPPHGGLAIGCERLTASILGLRNIREASFFPRDRKRLTP